MLGVERKRERKHAPIVSYDTDPRPARKRIPRENVYVEPARTRRDVERRSRHRPQRYEVVEVTPVPTQDGTDEPVRLPPRSRVASLYGSNMRRPRREYRIEERMPGMNQDRERIEREREEARRRDREWRESGR